MANELPVTNPEVTAPGLDSELDDALTNAFKGKIPETVKETAPIEKEIPTQKEEVPAPKEAVAKASKPVSQDKQPLPDPEEVPEVPPGEVTDKSKDGWNALRNNYKKAKGLVQEREEKIKKLESALAEKGTTSTKEVEDLKAKIQELSKYQATTDLQTDPEFVSKFDAPIQEKVSSMKTLLKEWKISDDVVEKIDFSNKNTLGAIAKAIRTNQDNIESEFSIEEFMTNARDVIDLYRKKNSALDEHGKNYKQVLEEKKKQAFARSAEDEGRTMNHLKEIAASKDPAGNVMFPFLNKQTPKEGSTPTEVADIENHNKFVDNMYEKIDSEIKTNDPDRKAKLVVAAAASHYLSAQLKTTVAKLKAVEEELKKVSAAGNDTDKTKIKAGVRSSSNGKDLDLDSALSSHFANVR